jgi:hypothetical protein
MGRGPLLKRRLHPTKRWGRHSPSGTQAQTLCVMRPPLTPISHEIVVLCGISSPFEELFPTRGQVTHVLLTRAPLYSPGCPGFRVRLACVRHAASVRSEPGSNSPSAPTPVQQATSPDPLTPSTPTAQLSKNTFSVRAEFNIYLFTIMSSTFSGAAKNSVVFYIPSLERASSITASVITGYPCSVA